MAVELNALRDQIDAVDKQMLELLAQRLALVEKVGEVKANTVCQFTPQIVRLPCWRHDELKLKKWGFLHS